MKVVYKYELVKEKESLKLPKDSKFLSVINQNNRIMVYALVDTSEVEVEEVEFLTLGTGAHVNDEELKDFTFLGTVTTVTEIMMFVFHVFYRKIV